MTRRPERRSARKRYVAVETELPTKVGENGHWKGQFGEAVVKSGIPPPERRSLQQDIWWLLDNVLKSGDCLDINRNYDQVRVGVARYIRERHVQKGSIKVRALERGKTRIWKLDSGFERPDT